MCYKDASVVAVEWKIAMIGYARSITPSIITKSWELHALEIKREIEDVAIHH